MISIVSCLIFLQVSNNMTILNNQSKPIASFFILCTYLKKLACKHAFQINSCNQSPNHALRQRLITLVSSSIGQTLNHHCIPNIWKLSKSLLSTCGQRLHTIHHLETFPAFAFKSPTQYTQRPFLLGASRRVAS